MCDDFPLRYYHFKIFRIFVKENGIPRVKFVKFAPGKFSKKTKDHTQRVSVPL